MSMKFHIGDILSITTGRLVSPDHMDGIYKILNFMTRENLCTLQLPEAIDKCKPFLIEQMPWLAEISADDVNEENWESWMDTIIEKYGEFHEVEQTPIE